MTIFRAVLKWGIVTPFYHPFESEFLLETNYLGWVSPMFHWKPPFSTPLQAARPAAPGVTHGMIFWAPWIGTPKGISFKDNPKNIC
jgi:hypothetical protein